MLEGMARALARRGPDAGGIWADGRCGLAHRRLSIIDLAASHQPMALASSHTALAYNGEIYNYRDLRQELNGLGASFETAGDTEVVVRVLEQEGEAGLRRLDGMFAFAAWDRLEQRILLARDPAGEKPLFYARPRPDLLVFGSEIKALLEHPEVARELDLDGLRQVLRFRSVYGTRTLYRDVCQLEPGSWLSFGSAGLRCGRFWDLRAEAEACRDELRGASERELVERGRALLTSSVRNRLVADVPVGAFLSGGLDSSLIVASIVGCRRPDEPTYTFSVGFAGDRDSELPHARRVADALGTTHTEVPLTEADYMSELTELTGCRDAPLSEPADLAIARMSRVARERVKVVLSGEGSDEVFCGYPKYRFASAPGWLRFGLRRLGATRAQRVARWARLDVRRVEVAVRALTQPSELDRLVQWFSYLERSQLDGLLPGLEWSEAQWRATCSFQRAALEAFAGEPPAARMQGVDFLTWLPGNLLERGDRMTMASGLEARVPFLDKKLIAFGFALDPRFKIRGRVLKWIVREWARDVLPPAIVERPKWGFRVPLAEWFRGSLRDTLNDYLRAPRGLCGRFGTPAAISELLDAHDGGRVDANLALWTLLAAEVWYQDVFLGRDRGQ